MAETLKTLKEQNAEELRKLLCDERFSQVGDNVFAAPVAELQSRLGLLRTLLSEAATTGLTDEGGAESSEDIDLETCNDMQKINAYKLKQIRRLFEQAFENQEEVQE